MSSKAEKTSHNLHRADRLSLIFRSPALLKIVAWLGCLGFIGSTGIVWADLKPISVSQTEAQALVSASASVRTNNDVEIPAVETFGPPIPHTWLKSPSQVAADQLPNREVPIPLAPAAAVTQPTAKIVRPQHADVLVSDNYTVGVNGAEPVAEEFVNIPVPAPRQLTIPSQSAEMVNPIRSQVQPSYTRQPAAVVSKSVPAVGHSSTPYRAVPKVPSLSTNALKSTPRQPENRHTGISIPTPVAIGQNLPKTAQRHLAGFKPVIVTPMKPSVMTRTAATNQVVPDRSLSTALLGQENAIEIPVPLPRTQVIRVQAVAQLPQVATTRPIPTIAPIPTVRPAATNFQARPVAYVTNGEHDSTSELIYPLSSPAPITSSFGWRTHPITGSRRFHSGVDIGAPMGAPVVAAGSGTIISAGWVGGYGKAIIIQHNGVQQTLYGHLSEVFVQPGQRIEQGTVIGRVGSTGNSTGPHLHFESRMSTSDGWVAVDPGDDVKYALDNLRRAMPFAQRDLPPGVN
jgi:murein DD-endopeptidase MepM/ murein hydrolase activator NlpD